MSATPRERALDHLPGFTRDDDEPVFREAWEAEAFALVLRLYEAGYFSWAEWTTALATEIRSAQMAGDPDRGGSYYQHWLTALERMCAEKRLVDQAEANERKKDWRKAYLATPHGQAVKLEH